MVPLAVCNASRFGAGGVSTGRGADLIVIDDAQKPEEALSYARRAAANEWYDSARYTRLNDKAKSAIVLVMHRLHEDNVAGHVPARKRWEIGRFPAIAETDARHAIDAVDAPRTFIRRQAAPWLAEYLHEMAVFPNGRFDDQIASAAQFLD